MQLLAVIGAFLGIGFALGAGLLLAMKGYYSPLVIIVLAWQEGEAYFRLLLAPRQRQGAPRSSYRRLVSLIPSGCTGETIHSNRSSRRGLESSPRPVHTIYCCHEGMVCL